ncbi:MAG TPA: hypothetical protein VKV02_10615, partial [Acidobacteriaceae bacterium]|nr:hypothetical protein [Acidobacteriaceae bacterium]
PLSPVVMTVTDLAGHALEETPVQVYQRVLGYEGACGTAERCPAAPVLATSQATVSSDANGSVTVTPLAAGNAPQVLEIAVSSGTTGFATMTLTRTP